MSFPDQPARTLRDAWRILFRHWRKALAFCVVVVSCVALATLLSPKIYRSGGKLLVRLGRENVGIDPTTTLGHGAAIAVPNNREEEINSVVEILRSRVIVEQVVDRLTPEVLLEPDATADTLSLREQAILQVDEQLGVSAVPKSNVLEVTFEHRDAGLSRRVVDVVMDAFLAEHVRLNRTVRSEQFLQEQTKAMRKRLTDAENELRDRENATGLVSPLAQREQLVLRVGRVKDDLMQTEAQAVALETELARTRAVLGSGPSLPSETASTGIATDALDDARKQLYTLQVREKQLLSVYTNQYPEVRQIREQIRTTREMIDEEEHLRHLRKWPQRTYEEAQISLVTKEPLLASLRSKSAELREQLADLEQELKTLHDRDIELSRRRRDVALLDASYRKYAESLEQASIDQALLRERISNISVAQPAVTEIKPVKPNTAMNLMLAMFFGVTGGLALAVAAEYFDHSFKTPEDVEKHLGLPVLASVPELTVRRGA